MLRHVYELTYPEIAETLEQPVGTVKANVHRGVRILRAALLARPDTRDDEYGPQTQAGTGEITQDVRHDMASLDVAQGRPLAMVTRWEGARR